MTGCSTVGKSNTESAYSVKLMAHVENEEFTYSVETYDITAGVKEEIEDSQIVSIQVGNQAVDAKLIAIEDFEHRGEREIYLSEDENIKYMIEKGSKTFYIDAKEGALLAEADMEQLTEEAFVSFVKQYLANYIDVDDVEEYTYKCATSIIINGENSTSSEAKEGFYLPTKENEEITGYQLSFKKYHNGIETVEGVDVACDADGSIYRVMSSDYDVDWGTVVINQKDVENSILAFFKNNDVTKHQVSGFDIQAQRLTYLDEEIQLSVAVNIDVKGKDATHPLLCVLLVEVGQQ